jgi:limonene-1,2-epoxide hydrolase
MLLPDKPTCEGNDGASPWILAVGRSWRACRRRRWPVTPTDHVGELWKCVDMPDPRATADRYVAVATADGKEALAELFTVEAVFHAPDGRIHRGRDEIAAFYRRHLANVVPTFHVHRAVVDGNQCWIELANGPEDNPALLASNHFTVDDDGRIEQLVVFLRPRPAD